MENLLADYIPNAELANCASTDPDLFFPESGESVIIPTVVAICAACDIKTECLDYALRTDQEYGVWGGATQTQLAQLRKSPIAKAEHLVKMAALAKEVKKKEYEAALAKELAKDKPAPRKREYRYRPRKSAVNV